METEARRKEERDERDIHVIGGWLVPHSLQRMGIFNRTEGPFRRVFNL